MSPATPSWRRMLKVALPLAGALALAAAAAQATRPGSTSQPFPFNHSVHIKAKVDCLQCHSGVMDREEPRFPAIAVCAKCHKEPPGSNQAKQKLAELVASKVAFDWVPLSRQPDHVFFSHPRHVDVAELECTGCHADMATRQRPPSGEHPMAMKTCMDCHARHPERPVAVRASKDCAACHR